MKTVSRITSFVLLAGWAAVGAAQYSWIEPDGRKVFSDQPPPLGISEKNVLQRPAQPAARKPATAAASATSPGSIAGGGSAADRELAARLKKADDETAARKQAEEQRSARVRADNCTRAQQARSTYASGVPLAQIDAQGRRVRVDEATRATELERLGGIIASDCR